MNFYSRHTSICPRVQKENGRLVATTAWRLRLLTLGAYLRRVTVDPKKEVIQIETHWLWLFQRRRRIVFERVTAVSFGYRDLALVAPWTLIHDSVDLFKVGLRLREGEDVGLCSFYGDGTFRNNGPFPDWFYWNDYLFDLSGTQESESRAFVELLGKMINVPVEAA
jgi:hypothetical protein